MSSPKNWAEDEESPPSSPVKDECPTTRRSPEIDLNQAADKPEDMDEEDDADNEYNLPSVQQWRDERNGDMIIDGHQDQPLHGRPSPQRSASSLEERSFSPKRFAAPSEERSPFPKRSASPETKPVTSFAKSPSPVRRLSPAPAGRSPSPVRQESLSPKKQQSSPRDDARWRRRERSPSKSPVAEADSRERYGRPRSRSPAYRSHRRSPPRDYSRSQRSRYSPQGRYSPRRSPPSRYRPGRGRSPRRRPWSPPRNRNTGYGKPGNNLFIAGFSFGTTERDLERKFSRYGHVTDVRIVRDKRSGDSRGFGFLTLERDEDADAAIKGLDQTEWNGRIVLVEKAKTSAR